MGSWLRNGMGARLQAWSGAVGGVLRARRPFLARLWSLIGAGGGELPEGELIRRAQAGGVEGRQAFNRLVERHQQWLVRYLYFLLGGGGDAEDVAQEALVRAYLALEHFRGESSFRTWLRPIATRLAFNHRRDAATRRRYEDMLEGEEGSPGPELSAISRDVLIKVMAEMSYPYREILVLRYVEELEVGQVAEMLNIGGSAAKMRLLRARDSFWDTYRRMVSDGHTL